MFSEDFFYASHHMINDLQNKKINPHTVIENSLFLTPRVFRIDIYKAFMVHSHQDI